MKLLTSPKSQPKTVKGEKRGYLTAPLHLRPSKENCPWWTTCKVFCLNGAGRGRMDRTQQARLKRNQWLASDPVGFHDQLDRDIHALRRKARREEMQACVRLNGTSDRDWSGVFRRFLGVQFYDYTKSIERYMSWLLKLRPANEYLTFSWSGHGGDHLEYSDHLETCKVFLAKGGTVAIPFNLKKGEPLPEWYMGFPVIDGDEDDLRFLDPPGVWVGLRVKQTSAKMSRNTDEFIVEVK